MKPLRSGLTIPDGFHLFTKTTNGTCTRNGVQVPLKTEARWVEGPCPTCGKLVAKKLNSIRGNEIYCSRKCMWDRNKAQRISRPRTPIVEPKTLDLEHARIIRCEYVYECHKCGQPQRIGSVMIADPLTSWCEECYHSLVEKEELDLR